MSLFEQITDDMKTAMRAKDAERLGTIRLLLAAIKQKEVDERIKLDDAAVVQIITKMVKQRKDSIEQFTAGARLDLAEKERAELAVLTAYMPAQLDGAAIDAQIRAVMAELGAASPADLGKVMPAARAKLSGRADMGVVAARVKALLSKS